MSSDAQQINQCWKSNKGFTTTQFQIAQYAAMRCKKYSKQRQPYFAVEDGEAVNENNIRAR
jgi:hypothetical protein